jgi:hypothetical protein
MTQTTIPGHSLIAYEEDFLEDGVTAVCECGWKSADWPTQAVALVAHQTHLQTVNEAGKKEPHGTS